MTRTHDRNFFYKYVTNDVAKLIIQKQELRWSCPLSFNDPFDHQIKFLEETNLEIFSNRILSRLIECIWDKDDIVFDTSTNEGQILTRFKERKTKISKDEFRQLALGLVKEMAESSSIANDDFLDFYQTYLSKTRVLCITEEKENLLMWAHYTGAHTGAVFKLNVIDDKNSSLAMAKKVVYSNEYPLLCPDEETIDNAIGIFHIDVAKQYGNLVRVKSDIWSYEKEWRISISNEEFEPNNAEYYEEPKEVFGAIYLGCKMSFKDIDEIVILSKEHLPNMEIWQAVQSKQQYKLEFTKVL